MSMSKRDYAAIAAAIKTQVDLYPDKANRHAASSIVNRLLPHFCASNPAFERKRFIEACGLRFVGFEEQAAQDERFALAA